MPVYHWNNCPPEIRTQVEGLLAELCARLGENLAGFYLHGSLALGSFNPLRSDLDLLGLLENSLEPRQRCDLAALMLELSRRPAPIEISLLRRADLSPWRYPTPFDFHYSESWRIRMQTDLDNLSQAEWQSGANIDSDLATHITLLLRRGICLYGQSPDLAFPLPPAADFLASLLEDVFSPEYGLGAIIEKPVCILLNACRTLAYLRQGVIFSKLEGGEWGLVYLPQKFHPLIQNVLRAYREESGDPILPRDELQFLAAYLQNEISAGLPPAAPNPPSAHAVEPHTH
ncbi:MAG TPA: aminoglycoside adenylyltransferase domain-containing protein [Anaerolineaceae bacterium]|nr:aminoglycoside adenylyltransferase domain-containing protein [Anaerolineaceae bacterium]